MKLAVRIYYPDTPDLPLPPGHRFPATKYRRLCEKLLREGQFTAAELSPSPLATRDDLLCAHDASYIDAVLEQRLTPAEEKRIGVPQSEILTRRARATVGGSLAAARDALRHGFSGQLAGGTHHAHRDFGSGFCVFNDFAVAALTLLAEGKVEQNAEGKVASNAEGKVEQNAEGKVAPNAEGNVARIAILDLDVHQGDGTAAILADEPSVMTVSVHGANNFPFRKYASTLDVALPDGTEDAAYLAALDMVLARVLAFRPDLVLYNSGVDALACDRLGRLAMTHDGLMARDRAVFTTMQSARIPLALGIGGGYGEPIEATVTAYFNTWCSALSVYGPK